jgi:hypothetical protein
MPTASEASSFDPTISRGGLQTVCGLRGKKPETKLMKERRKLKVNVEQEDIDSGIRAKSNACMIFRAIKRTFPAFAKLWVDRKTVRFTDREANAIYTFELPPFARVQLLRWDAGETVEPFSVRLKKPIVRYRTAVGSDGYPSVPERQTRPGAPGRVHEPKTKEGRRKVGRDRVFGAKLYAEELRKLRESLEIKPAHAELAIS